ncbi:MAG TPA: hypothetical protein VFB27_09900, partial [Opitutaceae bacterium]|nr:hypothetical protein [Opitutaceae bacterium]
MSSCERLTAAWFTALLALAVCVPGRADAASADVMPAPAELRFTAGRLALNGKFSVAITGHDDVRLRDGLARALRRWEARTGLVLAGAPVAEAKTATLVIDCGGPGPA